MTESSRNERLIAQHKRRLNHMPWLYFRLKKKQLEWALPWQQSIHERISEYEEISVDGTAFLAENVAIFAEPGRDVTIGSLSHVGADCFIHGPVKIGRGVGVNHQCSFDGGRGGIEIGDNTRIAHQVSLYAFNHRMAPDRAIRDQGVSSEGIVIGKDVWIGAKATVVDGVTIGDHAVIAANACVTRNIPSWAIAAGNPATIIGDRRDKAAIQISEYDEPS